MTPTRREFLWTMGATALALQQAQEVFWTAEGAEDPGWAPGIETRRRSACLICPARCGIQGRMVDGRLVRITGNPLHPMSQGGVCPRGLAGVQMLYHPERLASPLVRVGARGAGEWQPVSHDGAVALLVERLQDLRAAGRPEALAVVAGYCAGTMRDLWRRFLEAYGSPNYVPDEYEDGTDAIMALMHGVQRRPSYDMEQADLVLSLGAPLFESWWSPLQAFVAYARPDGHEEDRPRFIQVDARFSRTAARAQEWLGVQPGTHAVLALGIAYVLLRDELFDARFVSQHVSGFEDSVDQRGRVREGYRSLVMRHYRTEEVSAVTGVPVERITQLARTLARSRAPIVVCGSDVTAAPHGLLAGMAVHSLNVLLGSINRPGGVLIGDDAPLGALAALELDATGRAGLERNPVGGAPPPFGAGDPPLRFAEAIAAGSSPEVEALLLYYADPLASSTHPEAWRAALAKVPFVVSFSPFLDETTRHADLVLPDLLPYERWQDAPTPTSYPHPVWGIARPLVEPHTGGMHTGDAVLAVGRGLGGSIAQSLPYDSFELLLKERARGIFAARHGMTLGDEFERRHHRQMEERGWWLPEHGDFEAFWEELVERGGWTDLFYDHTDPSRTAQTSSGRIDLMPDALLRAIDAEGGDRTPYIDVAAEATIAEDQFPLRLMPYRVSTLASGTLAFERWLVEQPGLFPEVHWAPWVEVAPATAAAMGLADGTMVWVTSRRGRYRARLKIFPGTAAENVCAPYRLQSPEGESANPLQVLEPSSDSLTGLSNWYSTFIRLERA
jgi:anaerobic selenocysteine-containing dehydrogenase